MIRVVKRDGRVERLDIRKIQKYTSGSVEGLKGVSQSELEVDANLQFRDMITSKDIQETLIQAAVDKIDIDRPNWTFVASRLFLYDLYHKVSSYTGYKHLRDYFERGEAEGRILLGLKEKYDLNDLNYYLRPERDLQFTYLGIKTLYDRYLIKDKDGCPIELPQHLFMGVAMFLAQNEDDCQEWAKRFYDLMSKFEVMPGTPTISNARTPRHQLSSCFPKGEKVLTYSGFKNIEEIKVGEFVVTHKNRFKEVYELLNREYNSTLYSFDILGFEKNTLNCTSEHPILAIAKESVKCIRKGNLCIFNQKKLKRCFKLKGEYREDCEFLNNNFYEQPRWVEAKDIKVGDFMQVSYPTFNHKERYIKISDYIKLKNLEIVDDKLMVKREACGYEYYARSYYNHQINPIKNTIPLNSNFMRLIGYYLAEGHIFEHRRVVRFTFGSEELDYINDTLNIIKNLFDIKVNITVNRDNSISVSVHNKLFANFIYELTGSVFNKKILTDILLYAENQIELLVGVFRGNACVLDNGIALSLSNKMLIKQLYNIALREGLTPKIKVPALFKLATTQPFVLEINYLNNKKFVELVGKNLEKIKVKLYDKNGQIVGRQINQFWFNDNFYAKVNKIDKKEINETVYNLEVEDDHSYVVNNIAVHNCYIGSTPDNIEGIFDVYKEMALLSKFGGGIGWDWSQVRGMGSFIDGHKHAAGGIVPFLKIANDVAIAVDQLGCVAKNSFVRIKDNSDMKTIPISEVRIGDLVESFNIELDKVQYKKIEAVHELEVKKENQIKISFKDGYIVTSKWHPMAVKGLNGYFYKRSDELEIGELGVNHRGEVDEILFIDSNPKISEEYMDLTVQGTNNYFASTDKSDNFYLTHNTRRGAIAVYVEPWHIDIKDFLDLKKNSGEERRRAHDLFPALWLNDIFMQRVQKDALWTLFDPYEVRGLTELYGEEFTKRYLELEKSEGITKSVISAKGLWKDILRSYFETGNPFLTFKDSANRSNPNKHNGMIRSSNLCVTGDTKILTEEYGYIEIEKVTGQTLNCWNGEEWSETPLFQTSEGQEVITINFSNGQTIKATAYHKWKVILQCKWYTNIGEIEKRTDELKIGDKLVKFDLEPIPHGVKELELAYENGFFTGDETQTSEAKDFYRDNQNLIKDKFFIPDNSYSIKSRLEWLSGYFDAEGTVLKDKDSEQIQVISINRSFLQELLLALQELGINSKIKLLGKSKNRKIFKDNGRCKYGDDWRSTRYMITVFGYELRKLFDLGYRTKRIQIERENYVKYGNFIKVVSIEKTGEIAPTFCGTEPKKNTLMFNGVLSMNCTEIFQNTSPNYYKIKVTYNDKSIDIFEEEEVITVDSGMSKPAKKITALDSLNGKQIWMVDKDMTDGDTAVCNLASINLSKVNRKEDIARVVPIAIRMLDNVIDLNFYPLVKVKKTNEKTRAIGLGVMGEAQMLAESQIEWGSNKHFLKIDEVMESVSYYAIKSSSDLAVEKGKYPTFEGSEWSQGIFPIDNANKDACKLVDRGGLFGYSHDWQELREKVKSDGMRNGYLMAIAPTSSISILTGTTQAIEPVYKRKWFEENLSGMIPVVVPNLSPETWEYYTPSYELNQNILVKVGAIRQKWIDQGQSLNIFLSLDKASGKYLNEIYMNAWKLGLKSTYYLRSQSPEASNDVEDRSQECVGCQ